MFFVTLRTKGVILTPLLTAETKEARTMKLCTAIAYHMTNITKQLKSLNFHCSIVCSHCSIVCLIAKSELKMIKFSSSFKLNKIHTVDSPFNEDSKNIIFSQGRPNFGRGTAEKFKEHGQ